MNFKFQFQTKYKIGIFVDNSCRQDRSLIQERGSMKPLSVILGAVLVLLLAGRSHAQTDFFDLPSQYLVGGQPWSVFVGDFNGDGHPDVASVSHDTDSLTIMLNDGNGAFPSVTKYSTGDTPVYVHGADVDADSVIDLAISNVLDHTVSLFTGNGDGTFAAEDTIPAGFQPTSVRLADLDDDNYPDLIVTNDDVLFPFVGDSISVMLNNGDGTFQSRVSFEVGWDPQECVAIDLSGDSIPDLAVVNTQEHTISVLINNGSGTFSAKVDYESQHVPTSISAADLDGDGDVDLVAPNSDAYDRSVVSVILNNGDGTFAPTVYWNSGGYPLATFTSDLDHDTDIDIIVANWQTDSISVLINNGDATFDEPVQYLAGDAPASLFTADLNGDTFDDLAVGNRNSDDVMVFMNRGAVSSAGGNRDILRPVGFKLSQNVPNPFNPSTTIEYELFRRSPVNLTIHNVLGQLVARLVEGTQSAGPHVVRWDGMGSNGKTVAGGVYFYRLVAGDHSKTRKMVLLK